MYLHHIPVSITHKHKSYLLTMGRKDTNIIVWTLFFPIKQHQTLLIWKEYLTKRLEIHFTTLKIIIIIFECNRLLKFGEKDGEIKFLYHL